MGWASRTHTGAKARARLAYRQRILAYGVLPVVIVKQLGLLVLALLLWPPRVGLRLIGWSAGRVVRMAKRDHV
jgi:hypothetical protein